MFITHTECDNGTFGIGCANTCNCDISCNKVNGTCTGTCLAGWQGEDCQTRKPNNET